MKNVFRGRYLPLKTLLLAVVFMFCNNSVKAESEDFKQIWEIKNYVFAFQGFLNNQKEIYTFYKDGVNIHSMEDGRKLMNIDLDNSPDVLEFDEADSLIFFSQVRGVENSGLFMHDIRTGEQTRILGANHKNNINITLDTANDKLYFVTDSVGFEYILLCEYDYKKKDGIKILSSLLYKGTQLVYSHLYNKIYFTIFYKGVNISFGSIGGYDLSKQEIKPNLFDYLGDLNENQFDKGAAVSQPKDFRLSPNGRYLTLSAYMCLVAKVYDLQEEKLYSSINIGVNSNLESKQYRMFFVRDHQYLFNLYTRSIEPYDFFNKKKLSPVIFNNTDFVNYVNFATNDKDSTKIIVTDTEGNTRCYEVSPRITGIQTEPNKETNEPIILYPNPSTGLVNITLQNTIIENINIKLSSITGENIPMPPYFINGNILSINISTLPPTTYFITINNISYKLIKE